MKEMGIWSELHLKEVACYKILFLTLSHPQKNKKNRIILLKGTENNQVVSS
jgi:hypothetical protein